MRIQAPIKWLGGKSRIINFVKDHLDTATKTCLVDVFGGSGTVLLNAKPAKVNVYNDINGYLVNMYRVLQDKDMFFQLMHRLEYTPYSRAEFVRALNIKKDAKPTDKPSITLAWATIVSQNLGFGGKADTEGDFGYSTVCNQSTQQKNRIKELHNTHARILEWIIECVSWESLLDRYDSTDTLFYLDPPYPLSTRRKSDEYTHELTNEDHQAIANKVLTLKGKVAISTYKHPIYDSLLEQGFRVSSHGATVGFGNSDVAKLSRVSEDYKRTECIYYNFELPQLNIFE